MKALLVWLAALLALCCCTTQEEALLESIKKEGELARQTSLRDLLRFGCGPSLLYVNMVVEFGNFVVGFQDDRWVLEGAQLSQRHFSRLPQLISSYEDKAREKIGVYLQIFERIYAMLPPGDAEYDQMVVLIDFLVTKGEDFGFLAALARTESSTLSGLPESECAPWYNLIRTFHFSLLRYFRLQEQEKASYRLMMEKISEDGLPELRYEWNRQAMALIYMQFILATATKRLLTGGFFEATSTSSETPRTEPILKRVELQASRRTMFRDFPVIKHEVGKLEQLSEVERLQKPVRALLEHLKAQYMQFVYPTGPELLVEGFSFADLVGLLKMGTLRGRLDEWGTFLQAYHDNKSRKAVEREKRFFGDVMQHYALMSLLNGSHLISLALLLGLDVAAAELGGQEDVYGGSFDEFVKIPVQLWPIVFEGGLMPVFFVQK